MLKKRISALSRYMDAMIDREAWAFNELVERAPRPDEPDQQIISFDDSFFLLDDPDPNYLLTNLDFRDNPVLSER